MTTLIDSLSSRTTKPWFSVRRKSPINYVSLSVHLLPRKAPQILVETFQSAKDGFYFHPSRPSFSFNSPHKNFFLF